MDPIHYEKIADKLMQFRGKLPKDSHTSTAWAESKVDNMKIHIDAFLIVLDRFAKWDEQGLI